MERRELTGQHAPAMRRLLSSLSTLMLLLFASPLSATTVQQVAFAELVERAEIIVEGNVTNVYSRYDDDGRFIWTHVEVAVVDVLKGQNENTTLNLKFMGGTVGDMTLEISSMHYPTVGETGVYFVESANVQQMNPLVGWDQGRFKVRAGAEQIVTTADDRAIMDIRTEPLSDFNISQGIAHGVETRPDDARSGAMNLTAFKALVEAQSSRTLPNSRDE